MRKRVYKFIPAQYGISSLKEKRLKVTRIEELNDPFDLCPLDASNPAVSKVAEALTSHLWKTTAILCFSRNWDNILLWSHYGDSHKGICLGFDISEGDPGMNYDTDVLYQPNLLKIRSPQDLPDIADRLSRTKHESWSYEQEVRMFVELNDPPDAKGLNWIEFGSHLVLKEVIIGAQCDPATSKKVKETVKKLYGDTVESWYAGMRTDAFLLVKQADPPYWHEMVK